MYVRTVLMYDTLMCRVAPEDRDDLDEAAIATLVDSAGQGEFIVLDEAGMKKLLLALEKKINKNQLMRAKFADIPAK